MHPGGTVPSFKMHSDTMGYFNKTSAIYEPNFVIFSLISYSYIFKTMVIVEFWVDSENTPPLISNLSTF